MREAENIRELSALQPDYMGFIFYPQSKRYAGEPEAEIPLLIKKTGVFVNEPAQSILEKVARYKLQAVQLHGDETSEVCRMIKESGTEVIKAFGVDEKFDFSVLDDYEETVDYFLFDTKTVGYGGSGRSFNWKLLERYTLSKSYFLSGGLNPENIKELLTINDERFYAADLNSGFEIQPGMKNITEIQGAINLLRNESQNIQPPNLQLTTPKKDIR